MNKFLKIAAVSMVFGHITVASDSLCGKTASIMLSSDKNMQFTINEINKLNDDYCDVPGGEAFSNFTFNLLNSAGKIVYQKKFHLEKFSHFEVPSAKLPGKFSENKIAKLGAKRILKIPLNAQTTKAASYKIVDHLTKKESTGEIKW